MALIVFFLWRTMKLMPKTKPQEIKPDSDVLDRVGRGRRRRPGQGRAARGRRVPDATRSASRKLGAKVPEGHPPARPARHRQDAAGQGRGQRVRRAVLRAVGGQLRRDVRRPRRGPHPAPVRRGAQARAGDRLHRRDRRRRRQRGSDNNSEREQTLNQLLVEMDGFATSGDLVVIAASNLLDKLDPALLRPGRFDRQIFVSPPDVVGRKAILDVHTRNKPLAKDVDFEIIARQTSGLTGAELANIATRPRSPPRAGSARGSSRPTSSTRSSASWPAWRRATRSTSTSAASSPSTRPGTRCCAELLPGIDAHAPRLDRPARHRARLRPAPAGGGPLPRHARGADGPASSSCSAVARRSSSSSARSPAAPPTTSSRSRRSRAG